MDFIFADSNYYDCQIATGDIDIEIGRDSKNDFVVESSIKYYDGSIKALYCDGTEYGGLIRSIESNTKEKTVTYAGDTWRGLLDQKIIEPPRGQDYLYVTGELHTVMASLLGNAFGALIQVNTIQTSAGVSNFQVPRYGSMLAVFEKLLSSVGHKLVIRADGSRSQLRVILSAEPINYLSDVIEISQDTNLFFVINKNVRNYNYMICAGAGELRNRQIVYLHLWGNGAVSEVSSIPDGEDVVVYFHDYPNAETVEDLIASGIDKFDELSETDSSEVEISNADDDYMIGDVVGGRDYTTGIVISEPITRKIVKYSRNRLTIEYKVGD